LVARGFFFAVQDRFSTCRSRRIENLFYDRMPAIARLLPTGPFLAIVHRMPALPLFWKKTGAIAESIITGCTIDSSCTNSLGNPERLYARYDTIGNSA
jgi:hypothetical protein